MSANARLSKLESQLSPPALLPGKIALITGAAQGIGAACARLFARSGASVIIADLDGPKSEALAAEINSAGGKAIAVSGDITKQAYIDHLVKSAADFGNGKIHIVVNNAGYTWDAMMHKMSDSQINAMLAVHCIAPMQLLRAAAPYFRVKDGDERSIVNISSTTGVNGNVGQANYAVAKAGVTGLTKTIAKEWASFNVRCNCIAFGRIETRLTARKENGESVTGPGGEKIELGIPDKVLQRNNIADIPMQRAGTAEEAAATILAVASPLFAYVTGETIRVTGGRGM